MSIFLTTSICCLALASGAAESIANLPALTPQQVAWREAGVGLFFHRAPSVYQGSDGDNLSTPRVKINPDRFNADQWVQAVKAANAGYMIFVAKHVDGYCAWQTKTTDYSLKTSPCALLTVWPIGRTACGGARWVL
jgi:alpha-L-fucosidase